MTDIIIRRSTCI